MSIRYLLDEHISPSYRAQLLWHKSDLVVWIIGDPTAPAKGTSDPEILLWCQEHEFALVTNNRKSMPGHLKDHLDNGDHVPGIFVINQEMSIGEIIDELILIAEASLEDEYQDRILYLPIT